MSLNPLSPNIWQQRSELKKITRHFFDDLDFLEIDTPTLVEQPSLEPHLDPYEVICEGHRGFLTSSPEFGLKKALGSGLDRIFEISHSYRSHELGKWHSREFLMLEWYERECDLEGLLSRCAEFLKQLFPNMKQESFSVEAWMDTCGISDISPDGLRQRLKDQGVIGTETMDEDEAFFRLFLPTESQLEKRDIVFLHHYPKNQCSYAKVKGKWARRVEVYIRGIEVGNGFEEETCAKALMEQLQREQQERLHLNKDPLGIDNDFVYALDSSKEAISGMAMGWDRLFAAWSGSADLRSASPFLPSQQPSD
jgi:lysyl-tRNA synthetase class 2